MKPQKLWIFTTLLLVVHLIIQFVFFLKPDLSDGLGKMSSIFDMLLNLILIFILGVGLGALVALIPFRKKLYKEKFKITFPLLTSIVLVVFVATFSYTLYLKKVKGIELHPLIKYELIQIPENLNCSSVHNGQFETGKIIIERTDNKQIQTDLKTGEKKEYNVEWTNDCEYVLTSITDSLDKIRIKITAVNQENYGCYVNTVKGGSKYANFILVKRIK